MAEKKKLSERKAFNFYRSYFELASELSDKDRLQFYDAIIKYQFTKEEIELTGIAKIAFVSQKHSLISQVEGYENVGLRRSNNGTFTTPSEGASIGATEGASVQVQVQGKEQEKRKPKKVFIPPTLLEVEDYFKENGYTRQSAIKAFKYYNVADWSDSKGNKIKNWKQKMQGVWFKDENKESTSVKIKIENISKEIEVNDMEWIESLKPSMYNTTTRGVFARINGYIKFLALQNIKETDIEQFKNGFGKWYEKHKNDF
jgi:hypothetical protein